MEAVLAVDIGGTKLAAALVDPDGTVVRRGRVPTAQAGGPTLCEDSGLICSMPAMTFSPVKVWE